MVYRVSAQRSTKALTSKQASEVLLVLAGAQPPGITPWDYYVTSPSVVLGQSLAGARIYRTAEDNYFLQQELSNRFIHNYNKAVAGLTKDEKNQIALYRLRLDENGVRVIRPKALPPKLKAINDQLTRFVFEPIFQRGVKEKLITPDRHIDDYLSYYRDDAYRLNRRGRAEYAAQLAQELGLPLHVAEKILEEANIKKVTFGPFDYRRLAETSPGLRDLDRISEIYIKGFARKVAVTRFLAVANKTRPKIQDEHLRKYAKRYIDQYAGKARTESTDAYLERLKQSVPLLRKLDVSAAGIAGTATSVQFMAKLGFNLFSPVLNLTQTVINTCRGGRAAHVRVLPKAAAAILLPKEANPWTYELAKLKRWECSTR